MILSSFENQALVSVPKSKNTHRLPKLPGKILTMCCDGKWIYAGICLYENRTTNNSGFQETFYRPISEKNMRVVKIPVEISSSWQETSHSLPVGSKLFASNGLLYYQNGSEIGLLTSAEKHRGHAIGDDRDPTKRKTSFRYERDVEVIAIQPTNQALFVLTRRREERGKKYRLEEICLKQFIRTRTLMEFYSSYLDALYPNTMIIKLNVCGADPFITVENTFSNNMLVLNIKTYNSILVSKGNGFMPNKGNFLVQCKDDSGKCREIGYNFEQNIFFIKNKNSRNLLNFPGEKHATFVQVENHLFKK